MFYFKNQKKENIILQEKKEKSNNKVNFSDL